jgi:TRAP-type C4-dicarboxylate transport system substrate-binding protein
MTTRMSWFAAAALLGGVLAATPASAQQQLVYGNWTPPREYQNAHVMPEVFKNIENDTKGAIKWKLVPGGALADAKATFPAVKDGVMDAGFGIPQYVPSTLPSLFTIYSHVVLGHNDVVASTGAALEVLFLRCPSCFDEFRKNNAVPLGGWTSSAYLLACTAPIKSPADLKGKRIRAAGGNAELMAALGGVPVGATLTEAVGLLQRGGLDCQHGIADWLRTFGYADFAKHVTDYPLGLTGPAVGWVLNRDVWNKFTPEQKQIHLKHATWMSAKMAIGNFLIANEEALGHVVKEKGVAVVKVDGADAKEWERLIAEFQKSAREKNIENAQKLGVPNPGALIDDYDRTITRWRGLSKDIGRDIDKFAAALTREIFSKVDLSKI